ncbi:hypothetical protein [Amorphus sp. MBR-141]
MALHPVAGSRIYKGGVMSDQADDFVESDYASETWTEIDGWQQCGPLGDTSETITTPLINRSRDVKQKGTANAGSSQHVFAIIRDDAGQTALRAAARPSDKNNYAFKIEWESGTTSYFIALVMSAEEAGGAANTITMLNTTLEVNSNVLNVAA